MGGAGRDKGDVTLVSRWTCDVLKFFIIESLYVLV